MKYGSLYKGIINILIANSINIAFNLFNGFVLPKYLPIDDYAVIKSFQLYLNYIGILHFGYIDGVYLLYGGKSIFSLDKREIGRQRCFLLILQSIMTFILLFVSVILKDKILVTVSFCIITYNFVQYYKLLYQATGEFKDYSFIINMNSVFIFFVNFLLLIVFHSTDGFHFIITYTIIYLVIWIISEFIFQKKYIQVGLEHPKINEIKETISNGFPLMLGNFSSVMMTSIDRWFVKILMSVITFAQYSFAVSIENLLSVIITPISTTLYNFFCAQNDVKEYKKMHDITLLFSTFIVISAFPVKFVVEHFIPNYSDTLTLIFLLYASNIFLSITKCFYINLYKALKQQDRYFKCLIFVILVDVILNSILYLLLKKKESFAIATLISTIVWFIICRIDFQRIVMRFGDYFYIVVITFIFLVLGINLDSLFGFLSYLSFWLLLSCIFEREAFSNVFKMISKFITEKILHIIILII